MSGSDFTVVEATINDIQAALVAGQVSCREVLQAYLDTGPVLRPYYCERQF
jgi:Asp-tRNA(Asn)/Glu-tRNA(Gln) amidotransferase A subunit family amidase